MLEVVILCGGKGTRAYPDTTELPKPLLTVDGIPIVEHVMRTYAAQGHTRFILAAGYLGQLIAERYATSPEGLDIEVVDTGLETETGERLRRAASHVRGERFFATYADGLANVDLDALLQSHVESGALATVTTVALPSQYGVLDSDDTNRITNFREKPRLEDHWINGGFFVFEKAALDHWEGEVLERDVLPALSRRGALYAHRHRGFWKSMDTYKDRQEMEALATQDPPPWAVVPTPAAAGTLAPADGNTNGHALAHAGGRPPATSAHAGASSRIGNGNGHHNGNGNGHGAQSRDGAVGTRSVLLIGGDTTDAGSPAPRRATFGAPGAATTTVAPTGDGRRAQFDEWCGDADETPGLAPGKSRARRRLALFTAITGVIDLGAVIAAYTTAASIKTGALGQRLVGSDRLELLATVPIWLVAFAVYGLYDRNRLGAASEEVRRLLHAVAVALVGVVVTTFVFNQDVGRSWLAVIALGTLMCVGLGRVIARAVAQLLAARGIIGTRLLIVGANEEAHTMARVLDRQRWLGYHPVGLVATSGPVIRNGFPLVGTTDDIARAVRATDAAAVLIASSAVPRGQLADLCTKLHELQVDVRLSAGLPDVAASRVSVEPMDGLAVLAVRRSQLSWTQVAIKRAIDVMGASILLVLTAPLLAILGIAIRLTSRGPALFRQVRVGEAGRPFVLYKLRTMAIDAEDQIIDLRQQNEADGLLFKLSDDPRVTRLGKTLRRWGLDELPQLWNVLRGEMSLVGPRPPLPSESARYDEWIRGRLKVKPGITGLWQVKGGHVLGFDDYVRYDLFYVENWSVGLDLYVLARTLPALIFRRGMT